MGKQGGAPFKNPLFKGFLALFSVATFTFKSGQMARKSGQKTISKPCKIVCGHFQAHFWTVFKNKSGQKFCTSHPPNVFYSVLNTLSRSTLGSFFSDMLHSFFISGAKLLLAIICSYAYTFASSIPIAVS